MSNLFTIMNPAAGGGRARECFGDARERIERAGIDLDVHETEGPGHAREIAREAREAGVSRFLAVGGDGTSFEVVDGIFGAGTGDGDDERPSPTLAMLPLGTGNSFLRDFDIDTTDLAIEAIARGREKSCDVIRARHRDGVIHYINLLSIGFTADAGDLMNRRFKALGPAGYVLATVVCTARLKHPVFPLRLDRGDLDERPAVLLSFSNSKFTGGTMMMAPGADVGDGELDVIRVGKLSRVGLLRTFPKIFTGKHLGAPGVEATRAKRVDLEGLGELECMVDGEVIRLTLEALEVLPGALKVIA
ncbi:MAG: diacylglycerol kinase family lipid kinase [Deltaproteobacteria bacterium]|nr:diacylglycerol kinase family lipid kinase [Deltaproteobacteria bacterium]